METDLTALSLEILAVPELVLVTSLSEAQPSFSVSV